MVQPRRRAGVAGPLQTLRKVRPLLLLANLGYDMCYKIIILKLIVSVVAGNANAI